MYVAGGLAVWNADAGLIGRVGEDYPRQWLRDLEERGFDTKGIRTLRELQNVDLRKFRAFVESGGKPPSESTTPPPPPLPLPPLPNALRAPPLNLPPDGYEDEDEKQRRRSKRKKKVGEKISFRKGRPSQGRLAFPGTGSF